MREAQTSRGDGSVNQYGDTEQAAIEQQQTRLYSEQIKLLYTHVNGSLIASAINAVILLSALWYVIPQNKLMWWFLVFTVVSVSRYVLYRYYEHAAIVPGDPAPWGRLFTIGAVMASATWGAVGVVLFPLELTYQMLVIFVLAGTTAGAVVNLSSALGIAQTYIILTLTPLIIRFFIEADDIHISMGAMSLVFMLFMLFSARRMNESTLTSLKLRFENDDLISYLANEKAEIENLNVTLKQEIEERKRVEQGLRESEMRIRSIVENVPDGIITVNEEGLIESINAAAKRLFLYQDNELQMRHFTSLLPESERDEYNNFFSKRLSIGEGKMVGFGLEITGLKKDGAMFPIEVGIADMWLDKQHRFIAIIRDITERKKVDRMKTQFIAAVSHELRTPLTSVLGSLNLFSEGVAGTLNEMGESLLNIAHNNAERLVRQISDILDMDDIQSSKMQLNLAPIDLVPLVKTTLDKNRDAAHERSIDLVLHNELKQALALADSFRMEHALNHLLSNAIKFSPQGGTIEIAISRVEHCLRVTVIDQGPGIPEEFHNYIFQPFTQIENAETTNLSGAGLGLSIAKAIIEKHRGKIGFDANLSKGASFYFDIPEYQGEVIAASAGKSR